MNRMFSILLTACAVGAMTLAVFAPADAARPTEKSSKGPVKTAQPNCGSQTIYKPTGAAWSCTFGDEFDGTSLDTKKWTVQQSAIGASCYLNNSKNVSVANGALALTSRREVSPVTCGSETYSYSNGMVSGYGKFSQTYGRFEIRAKFPASKVLGLQSALWMWPVNSTKYGYWPLSGEIDIAEMYTAYPDRAIPYIHYNSPATDATVTNNYCMIADVSAYHTYVLEWTKTNIKIMYDGQTCIDHSIQSVSPLAAPAPFDSPFFMALTQSIGVGGNEPTTATELPATTEVDYVHVWS